MEKKPVLPLRLKLQDWHGRQYKKALKGSEIERLLDCKVNLQVWVKVKKDWRDSDFLIKNFGYTKDEE